MLLKQWSIVVPVMVVLANIAVGDYVLKVEVLRYENQRSTRSDGFLCRLDDADACNNHFIFCLRPHDYPTTILSDITDFSEECPLGSYRTSNITGDNLTFTVGEDLNGGVPNPLIFNGTSWPGAIQLFIRINDMDELNVTRLVEDFNIPVELTTTLEKYFVTTRNFVAAKFIRVTFEVRCTVNSFGDDCGCVPRDDELGHFTCDGEGNVQCLEGYRNSSANCIECIPAVECSTVGGYCNTPGECICHVNYTGDSCSTDLDPCGNTEPCKNNGICSNIQPDEFECQCLEGYEGMDCGESTDECTPNPCVNGASCEDLHLDYTCLCMGGYEGKNCSVAIDECMPEPCQNGGNCTDRYFDFECDCAEGFTGKMCESIDFCSASPCLNEATCENIAVSYSCICTNGFSGRNCEESTELSLEAVIGGVVGASAILLLVLLVLVLACVYLQVIGRRSTKPSGGSDAVFSAENPTYLFTTSEQQPSSHIEMPPVATMESVVHKFDNPIYAEGPPLINEPQQHIIQQQTMQQLEQTYSRLHSDSITIEDKPEDSVYYSTIDEASKTKSTAAAGLNRRHEYESLDRGIQIAGKQEVKEHDYDYAGSEITQEDLSLQLTDPYDDIVLHPKQSSRRQYEEIEDIKQPMRKRECFSATSDEGFVTSPFDTTLQSTESLVAPWETMASSLTVTAEYTDMQISELDM